VVALAVALVVALVGSSCSSGSSGSSSEAPPVTDPQPPVVYVAMGGVETLNSDRNDLPDNWPQLVFAEHLPAGAVYVNLATGGGTVKSAIDGQLPEALDLRATVATLWFENADLRLGTATRVYHDELTTLVEDLQAAGVHVVLIRSGVWTGDPPPLQATVGLVAEATGATLVDLGDISDRNDDTGQRRIASQVAAAIGAG
jgi:hypothetical protein